MTKRDFFRVVVKLFGLYSAVTAVFYILPSNVSFLISGDLNLKMITWLLTSTVVSIFLFVFLIFKADAVVNLLKLDHGFDNDQILFGQLSAKNLIAFSCILIGGVMILDNITQFVSAALNAFADKVSSTAPDFSGDNIWRRFYFDWFSAGINVLFGYLLIRNNGWIAEKFAGRKANTKEI